MSTFIRPELSSKNKYWIDRHRYYELLHFCLQYPLWKKKYTEIDGWIKHRESSYISVMNRSQREELVSNQAEARLYFSNRIEIVERAAEETDPVIGQYILNAVTNGVSYEKMKARLNIPCCKDTYYDLYRKFFWILDKLRK